MTALTILHTESSTGWGGQENRTLRECEQLRGLGARMLIACQPEARLGQRAREAGFEVFPVSMPRGFHPPAMLRLARIAARERVDVVNTHSGRDTLLAGLAMRLLPRRPRIVRTRHLILPVGSLNSYKRLPDHVVAVSRAVADYLVSVGLPRDHVSVVSTGVDTARFDPEKVQPVLRTELGLSPDTPLIGTIAILRAKKGHLDLLGAIPKVLERHPEAVFVFAGDGPQRANLETAIAERGLQSRVHLLGLRRDVPEVLRSLDVFVLPTHEEALGTAFLEAQAMGLPAIGTRVGGVPEAILEGETGMLVPAHDPAALAAAIGTLLDDPAHTREMGRKARTWVCSRHSVEVMGRDMLDTYVRLCGRQQ